MVKRSDLLKGSVLLNLKKRRKIQKNYQPKILVAPPEQKQTNVSQKKNKKKKKITRAVLLKGSPLLNFRRRQQKYTRKTVEQRQAEEMLIEELQSKENEKQEVSDEIKQALQDKVPDPVIEKLLLKEDQIQMKTEELKEAINEVEKNIKQDIKENKIQDIQSSFTPPLYSPPSDIYRPPSLYKPSFSKSPLYGIKDIMNQVLEDTRYVGDKPDVKMNEVIALKRIPSNKERRKSTFWLSNKNWLIPTMELVGTAAGAAGVTYGYNTYKERKKPKIELQKKKSYWQRAKEYVGGAKK